MARLRTSQYTKDILLELKERSNLRPNILARIAINLSINQDRPVDENNDYDNNGLEFHKEILFGEFELLYKSMMIQKKGKFIPDDIFFPEYTKLHLERGTKLLYSEYEFAGNFETFFRNLLDNKVGNQNDLS